MEYNKEKAVQLLNSLVDKNVLVVEGFGRGTKIEDLGDLYNYRLNIPTMKPIYEKW